jgi:hypothetical protein
MVVNSVDVLEEQPFVVRTVSSLMRLLIASRWPNLVELVSSLVSVVYGIKASKGFRLGRDRVSKRICEVQNEKPGHEGRVFRS